MFTEHNLRLYFYYIKFHNVLEYLIPLAIILIYFYVVPDVFSMLMHAFKLKPFFKIFVIICSNISSAKVFIDTLLDIYVHAY